MAGSGPLIFAPGLSRSGWFEAKIFPPVRFRANAIAGSLVRIGCSEADHPAPPAMTRAATGASPGSSPGLRMPAARRFLGFPDIGGG